MGLMCRGDAEGVFESVRVKMDTACISAVRLLESLCCLDINRFAKPEKPLTGSLPILFVLMLIVMLYNAFVFGYMPAAGIAWNSSTSLMFHSWIFLVLASFSQAVRTDPGSTPMTPNWCNKDHPPAEARERKRCSEDARWCRKSGAYKPDRAHYCRVLKKGVLRMDHYCPWLGNTVGFHNQKFFFLFLFYTNLACGQLGISFLQLLIQYTLPAITTFCLIGAEGLTLLVSSLLVPFFLFHFWLIARNTTTIEFCERMRENSEEGAEAAASLPGHYDLGIFRNFCTVLGSNPLLWLLPVGGPPGDGITFPISPEYQRAVARAAAAAGAAMAENKSGDLPVAAKDDDPEASHPAAVGTTLHESAGEALIEEVSDTADVEGKDLEKGSGDGEGETNESEAEASEGSDVSLLGSVGSKGDEDGFLTWRDSAEFAEDLTIGCKFIAEKAEDCTRGSFMCLATSCMPGAWGRKAAKIAGARLAPWKRALTSTPRGFPESSRQAFQKGPAVRIVPARGGGALSSGDEGDSCSSASGPRGQGQGDFLSD